MVNCSEMPSKYALCKIYVCVHVYKYVGTVKYEGYGD